MKAGYRKIVAVVLALAACFAVCSACSLKEKQPLVEINPPKADTEETRPKLGVVTYFEPNRILEENLAHAEDELGKQQKLADFDYRILAADTAAGQIAHIRTLIHWGATTFVIWPADSDSFEEVINEITGAGGKVILYDRKINGFTPVSFIAGDNYDIGAKAAEYLNSYFADEIANGEDINYLEYLGDESSVSKERTQGFEDSLSHEFKLMAKKPSTGWNTEFTANYFETWLNKATAEDIESLKAIFVHSDEIGFGVLQAINDYEGEANLDVKVMASVGGGREYLSVMITDGIIKPYQINLIYNPNMIRKAIETGVKVATTAQGNRPEVQKEYIYPTQVVLLDNLYDYIESEDYISRYNY